MLDKSLLDSVSTRSAGEQKRVFYLIELQIPSSDNKRKSYLYAGGPNREDELRMRRVRNIYDWETEIYQASRILGKKNMDSSSMNDKGLRLVMES